MSETGDEAKHDPLVDSAGVIRNQPTNDNARVSRGIAVKGSSGNTHPLLTLLVSTGPRTSHDVFHLDRPIYPAETPESPNQSRAVHFIP